MKIGVTIDPKYSFFSAGSPQTALAVAEVYRLKGHEVIFVGKDTWFEDCSGLRAEWKMGSPEGLDLVIEVGGVMLSPEERAKAKRCVWLCRKAPLINDIEACLYPFTQKPERVLEGVSEIWLFSNLVSSDDIQYLELLTRKPVRTLPFLWTPSAIEFHRRDMKAPVWQQVAALPESSQKPWSIHICETNTSSTSSCTIPLFIMRETKLKTKIPLNNTIKIHNADNVKGSNFFQDNVYSHAIDGFTDISGIFVGRQRVIDFVYDPKSIIIAHSRFFALRPYLLDAAWVGIPLVHNSVELSSILNGGFYPDNDIIKGKEAFIRVVNTQITIESLMEVRKQLLDKYSPLSETIQEAWEKALGAITTNSIIGNNEKETVIGFCDMWDSFNPEYNQFILMLQAAQPNRRVVGVDLAKDSPGNEQCDVVIFGPFGSRWKDVKEEIPKVHYTGENTEPLTGPGVKLNLGFKHGDFTGDEYLRLPLWMLEINWFRADAERIGNPKPLPIDRCCNVFPEEISRKQKFCSFVVTNPCQPMRNNAFQWLSKYKHIDSAGRLFNNIGDKIFAGLGGGGGELKKFEFLKDYKFCLTFENSSAPGYCTEKMLHAKAAGCIPIYWGDLKVERDFNPEGFIDARNIKTSTDLIELVSEVDKNPSVWLRKFSVPCLDEIARDRVRRTLAECARRIWCLVGVKEDMPEFIGFCEDEQTVKEEINVEEEVKEKKQEQPIQTINTTKSLDDILLVTAANTRFLPSLQLWLQTAGQMKQVTNDIGVRVYFMEDVSKDVEQQFIESFPFAEIKRFPTEVPPNSSFKDLWEPEHYAWKIWIYQELVKEESLRGRPILYMDAGIMMSRWPKEWLNKACEHGICVLEDPREENDRWCHTVFKQTMKMTKEECEGKQIVAGILAFIGGHPLPSKIFAEAWKLAQQREVIVGKKWEGVGADGKPRGHRHDQSILSLLTLRNSVPNHPLDSVYCDVSLRHTFLTGASLYVHRGHFKVHEQVLEGIDDVWVINLDRRKDRMERFYNTHPDLKRRALRLSAFEGVNLELTPKLARLFAPHDFKWKKAVMGCALSHLAIWMKLIHEKPDINSYLVLEDDAKLSPEWRDAWEEMMTEKALPNDWDVIYLGGVLPPNREAFEAIGTEPVNDHLARVRKNTIFGQKEPSRYFHFCAYSYVLSKRGAMKIVEVLKARGGYWTSADHMICNIHEVLNIYYFNPLIAGCYQDDDPVYRNSQFNDFNRKDNFDSDLWNNNEHFSQEEVDIVLKKEAPLDILGALEDARKSLEVKRNETKAVESNDAESKVVETKALPPIGKRRLVNVCGGKINSKDLYEYSWLQELFGSGPDISLEIERVCEPQDDSPIVLIQGSLVEVAEEILSYWRNAGKTFYLLHLSDEYGRDSIEMYSWKECLGVIRNYVREDAADSDKVKTIPLGWHWAISSGEPYIHTPQPPFREFVWSFVGTGWCGRKEKLELLKQIPGDHKLVFQDNWHSSDMLGKEENMSILLNSWFVPCPGGQNPETFRIYEALEAGAMPIIVKEEGFQPLLEYLGKWLPLIVADNWVHAAQIIYTLKSKPEIYEQYRVQVLTAWEKCKRDVKESIKKVFGI
jgi:GR25 family glycosyltransferase involved in LPS biosynthesis